MSPVHFLANSNRFDSRFSSSRYCCPNFRLLDAFLTFTFNRFISLLYSGSELFLSILCGTDRSILSNMFLKLFRISTHLPLPAHIANLFRRKVYKPKTFVLWYTGTSLST
jgi:hypothetical protein